MAFQTRFTSLFASTPQFYPSPSSRFLISHKISRTPPTRSLSSKPVHRLIHSRSFSTQETHSSSSKSSKSSVHDLHEKYSPPPEEPFDDPREAILNEALKFVPVHGWSLEALSVAAESLHLPSVAHGMFPEGAAALVDFFFDKCNRDLITAIPHLPLDKMTPLERVEELLLTRLRMIYPYQASYPQALAIATLPSNLPGSLGHLARMVDEVWAQSGDRSVDMEWYYRRGSVGVVYLLTEIFFVTDQSLHASHSEDFLHRRLKEWADLQATRTDTQHTLGMLGKGVEGVLESWGGVGKVGEIFLKSGGNWMDAARSAALFFGNLQQKGSQRSQESHRDTATPKNPVEDVSPTNERTSKATKITIE